MDEAEMSIDPELGNLAVFFTKDPRNWDAFNSYGSHNMVKQIPSATGGAGTGVRQSILGAAQATSATTKEEQGSLSIWAGGCDPTHVTLLDGPAGKNASLWRQIQDFLGNDETRAVIEWQRLI